MASQVDITNRQQRSSQSPDVLAMAYQFATDTVKQFRIARDHDHISAIALMLIRECGMSSMFRGDVSVSLLFRLLSFWQFGGSFAFTFSTWLGVLAFGDWPQQHIEFFLGHRRAKEDAFHVAGLVLVRR